MASDGRYMYPHHSGINGGYDYGGYPPPMSSYENPHQQVQAPAMRAGRSSSSSQSAHSPPLPSHYGQQPPSAYPQPAYPSYPAPQPTSTQSYHSEHQQHHHHQQQPQPPPPPPPPPPSHNHWNAPHESWGHYSQSYSPQAPPPPAAEPHVPSYAPPPPSRGAELPISSSSSLEPRQGGHYPHSQPSQHPQHAQPQAQAPSSTRLNFLPPGHDGHSKRIEDRYVSYPPPASTSSSSLSAGIPPPPPPPPSSSSSLAPHSHSSQTHSYTPTSAITHAQHPQHQSAQHQRPIAPGGPPPSAIPAPPQPAAHPPSHPYPQYQQQHQQQHHHSHPQAQSQPQPPPPPPSTVPSQYVPPPAAVPPPPFHAPGRRDRATPVPHTPAPPPVQQPQPVSSNLDFLKLVESYKGMLETCDSLSRIQTNGYGEQSKLSSETLDRLLQQASYGAQVLEAAANPNQPQPPPQYTPHQQQQPPPAHSHLSQASSITSSARAPPPLSTSSSSLNGANPPTPPPAPRPLSSAQQAVPNTASTTTTTVLTGPGGTTTVITHNPASGAPPASNPAPPATARTKTPKKEVMHPGQGTMQLQIHQHNPGDEKAAANGSGGSGSGTGGSGKRNKHGDGDENQVCLGCGATSTPEWRRGPMGPRTLCNACGLVYAKMIKKRVKDTNGAAGKNGTSVIGTKSSGNTTAAQRRATIAAQNALAEGGQGPDANDGTSDYAEARDARGHE